MAVFLLRALRLRKDIPFFQEHVYEPLGMGDCRTFLCCRLALCGDYLRAFCGLPIASTCSAKGRALPDKTGSPKEPVSERGPPSFQNAQRAVIRMSDFVNFC
jgi:hypothetical protein